MHGFWVPFYYCRFSIRRMRWTVGWKRCSGQLRIANRLAYGGGLILAVEQSRKDATRIGSDLSRIHLVFRKPSWLGK
jgi:hypothetical protein